MLIQRYEPEVRAFRGTSQRYEPSEVRADSEVRVENLYNNPNFVERVLQPAIEYTADNSLDIIKNHSLEAYIELIKTNFQGFVYFPESQILIEKKDHRKFAGSKEGLIYKFDSVCPNTCGAPNCEETDSLAKTSQAIVLCRTCKEDPSTLEFYFHKSCSQMFHINEIKDHKIAKVHREELMRSSDECGTRIHSRVPSRSKFDILLSGMPGAWQWHFTNIGVDSVAFYRDQISAIEFALHAKRNLWVGSAAGLAGTVCAALRIALGIRTGSTPRTSNIFWLIGSMIGGAVAAVTTATVSVKLGWFTKPEDEQKTDVILNALLILEVPLPNRNFREIRDDDVMKCFRRKALQYHPDELPSNASEQLKQENSLAWNRIGFSRSVLISYCQDRTCLSNAVVKMIDKKWRAQRD